MSAVNRTSEECLASSSSSVHHDQQQSNNNNNHTTSSCSSTTVDVSLGVSGPSTNKSNTTDEYDILTKLLCKDGKRVSMLGQADYADFYTRRQGQQNHCGGDYFFDYKSPDRSDATLENYNALIAKDPNNPKLYHERGNIHFDEKNYEEALADYNKAIELDGNYFMYYFDRGDLYIVRDDFKQAMKDATKCIELNPRFPVVYISRAMVRTCMR
eukprot:GEZU01042820.1.p1 GENE.GEZU01042820.1~~GEZU01042820.1.p1  ORF type:complete len:213 (-),score=46.44 GEZU01042820.1:130-768(-)